MTGYALCCPRCGSQFEPIGTRVQALRICTVCELKSARTPLATRRLECRWYRSNDSKLHSEWLDVATNHAQKANPEIWLKVAVHCAGFASLLFLPSVGRLIWYMGHQLGLSS